MNERETPLVSVVIPTYNHGDYLGRALQSVLDQTYPRWEVIVIDNYSTDNTDTVIVSFADPRITYLKINNNGVIAASRNAGIRAAKGEWIAFLDSDDWWTNDKLEACLSSINDEVDFVYHDLERVSDQAQPFRLQLIKSWQVNSPVIIDLLINGNPIATSSVVVRVKILKQLNGMRELTNMVAAEDYNTWLRIAKLTEHFVYLPRKLGYYLLHNQSISNKDMSVPTSYAIDEFLCMLNKQQKNKVQANIKYTSGRFNFLAGNIATANKNLRFSLRYGRALIKIKSAIMIIIGCYHCD